MPHSVEQCKGEMRKVVELDCLLDCSMGCFLDCFLDCLLGFPSFPGFATRGHFQQQSSGGSCDESERERTEELEIDVGETLGSKTARKRS